MGPVRQEAPRPGRPSQSVAHQNPDDGKPTAEAVMEQSAPIEHVEVMDSTVTMSKEEARELTDRLKVVVNLTAELLAEARDREAWKALGYSNFAAYATAEFNLSQSRAYQLADQAGVISALREAAHSTMVEIPERVARGLKPHLDVVRVEVAAAAEEVRARGGDEEEVAAAVTDKVHTVRMYLDEQKRTDRKNRDRARRGWAPLPDSTSVADVEERRRQAQAATRKMPRAAHLKGTRHINPVKCVSASVDGIVGEVEVLVMMIEEGFTSLDLLLPEQVASLDKALTTMRTLLGQVRQ